MEALLNEIKTGHDELIEQAVSEENPQISQFAGVELVKEGSSYEEFLEKQKGIFGARKENLETQIASPSLRKKAIFLEKNFAKKIFHQSLGFYFFRHLFNNGKTYGKKSDLVGEEIKKERTEYKKKLKKALKRPTMFVYSGILGGLAGFFLFSVIISSLGIDFKDLSPAESFSPLFIGTAVAIFGIFRQCKIDIKMNRERKSREEVIRQWYESQDHDVVLRETFPEGEDYPHEQFGSSSRFVQMEVKFPKIKENQMRAAEEIVRVLKLSAEIDGAKPIVIAHKDAISLKINEETIQSYAPDPEPLVALETEHSIILFPDARWGTIEAEEEKIEEVKQIFKTEGHKLFS